MASGGRLQVETIQHNDDTGRHSGSRVGLIRLLRKCCEPDYCVHGLSALVTKLLSERAQGVTDAYATMGVDFADGGIDAVRNLTTS